MSFKTLSLHGLIQFDYSFLVRLFNQKYSYPQTGNGGRNGNMNQHALKRV
jgi:hypothetical protein